MEVVREFLNVLRVGEVVAEGVGIEGNGHGVDRSKSCSQRDRRETIRRGRGGTPPSLGSSRQRPRSIIDNRRSERRRGRRGGCIVRHGGSCNKSGLGAENGGMKLLIQGESGLGIFQIPFRDPRVFFS